MMEKLFLPSLRGLIGDWVYYPTLMKLKDIAERVNIAEEIYQSKTLNDMVQRWIKKNRGKEIKDYLLEQDQRFFNSLIVAVYDGDPSWYDITRIESNDQFDAEDIPEEVVAGIGILGLNGEEKLFTLDGQHRLIGIKEAVKESPLLGEDELAIIFIAHKTSPEGMERSRRLFTTLNKNAVRVSKGETIALDEDDTMAIVVRQLVTENPMFMEKRILNNATNNVPPSNLTCLTTIGNLYDLLEILFVKIYVTSSKKKKPEDIKDELTKMRLSDDILKMHYANACDYFERFAAVFPPLTEFFTASDYSSVVRRNRHSEGGNVLFRPIGLTIVTEIISTLTKEFSLDKCFALVAKLPTDLTAEPYEGVIWHPTQKKLIRGKTLAKNLLLYMLDAYDGDVDKLREDYGKALELETNRVKLPRKV